MFGRNLYQASCRLSLRRTWPQRHCPNWPRFTWASIATRKLSCCTVYLISVDKFPPDLKQQQQQQQPRRILQPLRHQSQPGFFRLPACALDSRHPTFPCPTSLCSILTSPLLVAFTGCRLARLWLVYIFLTRAATRATCCRLSRAAAPGPMRDSDLLFDLTDVFGCTSKNFDFDDTSMELWFDLTA